MRVVTSKQMKEIERRSLQYDLTYHRLMENAGSAAAAYIRRTFQVEGLNCMVFCGGGNNGGDGMVVARKLFENDAKVLVVMVGKPPESPEASSMYTTARLMEIPIADFSQNREKVLEVMGEADIVIDAIYGTGFHGALGDTARAACSAINSAIAAVIALDVPSGLNCDTGEADSDAVRADFTVVFDSYKPCHILTASKPYCGRVELADIGIPDKARHGIVSRHGLLTAETVFSHLPPRKPDSHKGAYGRVLSLCGSSRYRGAAVLSALGALRCGAGIVTLASTEPVCAAVAASVPEATLLPLPESALRTIDYAGALEPLAAPLKRASAVLFGPGMETNSETARLLAHVLRESACPVVLDADGINALAKNINILQEAKAPVILTPHSGEMARLTGRPAAEVEADRTGIASGLAQSRNAVVVLKGMETVIAAPDGGVFLNPTGNPGLAKGGSGDVLAGMIAAFVSQGIEPYYAAACGVFLHGAAADRTAERLSQYGMLPSELLNDLAVIFAENGR